MGIIIKNNRLDTPIENNYFFYDVITAPFDWFDKDIRLSSVEALTTGKLRASLK